MKTSRWRTSLPRGRFLETKAARCTYRGVVEVGTLIVGPMALLSCMVAATPGIGAEPVAPAPMTSGELSQFHAPTHEDVVSVGILGVLAGERAAKILGVAGLDPTILDALETLRVTETRSAPAGLKSRGAKSPDAQATMGILLPPGELPSFEINPGIYNRQDTKKPPADLPRLNIHKTRSVEWVFGRATQAVSNCYGSPVKETTVRRDKIVTSAIVEPSGVVRQARVIRSTVEQDYKMENCITDAIKSLRFPAKLHTVAVEIVYPWYFVHY